MRTCIMFSKVRKTAISNFFRISVEFATRSTAAAVQIVMDKNLPSTLKD